MDERIPRVKDWKKYRSNYDRIFRKQKIKKGKKKHEEEKH